MTTSNLFLETAWHQNLFEIIKIKSPLKSSANYLDLTLTCNRPRHEICRSVSNGNNDLIIESRIVIGKLVLQQFNTTQLVVWIVSYIMTIGHPGDGNAKVEADLSNVGFIFRMEMETPRSIHFKS